MMKLVCTISSMTTRSMVPVAAGPGGLVTIGKIVCLRKKTAVVTSATRGTAKMIVTVTQFAEFGTQERLMISTDLSVSTLRNAPIPKPIISNLMQRNYPKGTVASGSAMNTRLLTETTKFAGTLVIQSSPVLLTYLETKI